MRVYIVNPQQVYEIMSALDRLATCGLMETNQLNIRRKLVRDWLQTWLKKNHAAENLSKWQSFQHALDYVESRI